ncbi:transmembrane protein 53-like [Ptychodera flava]|uniref:transmembrane protein 53-like n=1 Tax=Ptychodera flava TaxID=63121 RepID=UPI003969BD32
MADHGLGEVLPGFFLFLQSPYTALTVTVVCFVIYDLCCRAVAQLTGQRTTRLSLSSAADWFDVVGNLDDALMPELTVTHISDNLELRTTDDLIHDDILFWDDISVPRKDKDRPMVLMFGWMSAKQRYINKYVEVYNSKGCDVLVVKMDPINLVWPSTGQSVAQELLDYIEKGDQKLIVHSFSVGGHLYGELLRRIDSKPDRYAGVKDRIVGQIFDSCTSAKDSFHSICDAITQNPVLWFLLKSVAVTYFWMTQKYTVSHIKKTRETLRQNPVNTPILMLYSLDDPIGSAKANEQLSEIWKRDLDYQVQSKCWDSSPHVEHMRKHRAEYVDAVYKFLNTLEPFRNQAGED